MMAGIGVQHQSESAFSFDRNGRSGWAGARKNNSVDKRKFWTVKMLLQIVMNR